MTRKPTMQLYRLEGHEPVREEDFDAWCMSAPFGQQVARTVFNDDLFVSTVFLGIDLRWPFSDVPALFETGVFHKDENVFERRYSTWAEAEAGHAICVAAIERKIANCNH